MIRPAVFIAAGLFMQEYHSFFTSRIMALLPSVLDR